MIISKPYAILQKRMWDAGSTTEEVVQYFTAHNIKGVLEEPSSCPFANFLSEQSGSQELDYIVDINVGNGVRYCDARERGNEWGSSHLHEIQIPRHVEKFIYEFDAEHYPHLISSDDE